MQHQIKSISGAVLYTADIPDDTPSGLVVRVALERLSGACEQDINGCWVWQFGLTRGYPRIKIAGQRIYAHRLMCEIEHGEAPAGRFACHHCGVRACINPEHLYWGTALDNAADAIRMGRTTKGRTLTEQHRRKVSEAQRGKVLSLQTRRAIAEGVRRSLTRKAEAQAA